MVRKMMNDNYKPAVNKQIEGVLQENMVSFGKDAETTMGEEFVTIP